MGMTMDQFKEQFREQADKQVKVRLAMEAIVAKESIEATEEEFEAEIKRIADAYQMEADKVKSLVDAAAVKKDLAVNKAIDFVKSKANIVAGVAERPPVFGFTWMTKGVYFIKFLLAFLLLLTKTGAVTE